MKKTVGLLLAGVCMLAACSDGESGGGGSSHDPSADPTAVAGSIDPVTPIGGLNDVGLDKATVSVETAPHAWVDDAGGITYVQPGDGAEVTIVRVGLDGAEQWKHTVKRPGSDGEPKPRLSIDEGLGVVSLWFTKSPGSDNASIVGDIRWFDLSTGEGESITPRRPDDSATVETWNTLIGYISFPQGYGASTSFTYLGADRQEHTENWADILKAGEASWLSGVTDGQPTYSVLNEEAGQMRFQQGNRKVLDGGASSSRWTSLPGGVHGIAAVPGSGFIVVDGDGNVVLDYAGDCETRGEAFGRGDQLWSGSLIYDVSTKQHHCLQAIGEAGGKVMGMTDTGIALAHADEHMIFSEPRYSTVVESDIESPMWPRGGYLIVNHGDEEHGRVSVFNAGDLKLH